MGLHRRLLDFQLVRDLLVEQPLAQHLQHRKLFRRQRLQPLHEFAAHAAFFSGFGGMISLGSVTEPSIAARNDRARSSRLTDLAMKPAAPQLRASWMMRGSSSAETTTIGTLG